MPEARQTRRYEFFMKVLTVLLIVTLLWSTMPIPCGWATPQADIQPAGWAMDAAGAHRYRISMEEFRQIEPMLQDKEAQGASVIVQMARIDSGQTYSVTESAQGVITNGVAGNVMMDSTTNHFSDVPTNHIPVPSSEEGTPGYSSSQASSPPDRADSVSCNGFFDLTRDLGRSNWSDNDAAIVIFVVVGAVVVFAVLVYAGAFLYELATGKGTHSYWWDMEGKTSFLCSHANSGHMAGARLSSGFENAQAKVGLVFEAGSINAEIHPQEAMGKVNVEGGYAMAGAGIRWPLSAEKINPSFIGVELLAGTSSDESVRMMSTACASLSFGLGLRMRLGASLGALYLGLDPTEGPLKKFDNFTTLVGIQAGYRF